jgi:hypothetical protein
LISVEETEDFATDLFSTGLFVVHDTLIGGQDDEAELTGGENAVGEVFEILELEIETGGNDTTLVKTTVQVNNDLASASIVDDCEFVDVALLLHDAENFDEHLRDGVEDNLIKTLDITVEWKRVQWREIN